MIVDRANLTLRVLSALVLIPIALAAVYLGGVVFVVLVAGATMVAFDEWMRLIDPTIKAQQAFTALAASSLVFIVAAYAHAYCGPALILLFIEMVLFYALLRLKGSLRPSLLIAFGFPYLIGSGLSLIYLRQEGRDGFGLTVFLLAVVWATDIGAFAAGRTLGGKKLAPRISPKKTWSGLFGGMALAAVFGYIVAFSFEVPRPFVAALVALPLAVIAQMGDLFKSYFKRQAGVKDSGRLIPGHGGALDRIDGLVFAAVAFVFYDLATGADLPWW